MDAIVVAVATISKTAKSLGIQMIGAFSNKPEMPTLVHAQIQTNVKFLAVAMMMVHVLNQPI